MGLQETVGVQGREILSARNSYRDYGFICRLVNFLLDPSGAFRSPFPFLNAGFYIIKVTSF